MRRCLNMQRTMACSRTSACRGIRWGFTLIEVMMVLLVLSILISLILNLSRHAREASQKAQAIAELGEFHHGLARYFSVHECYPVLPPESPGPVAMSDVWLATPSWASPESGGSLTNRWTLLHYLPRDFSGIDPWGAPYWYNHSTNAPLHYQLYSQGPNNPDNLSDDARIHFQP